MSVITSINPKIYRMSFFLLLSIILLSVIGCSTTGEPRRNTRPVNLNVMIIATPIVNPNLSYRSSPVKINLVQLSDHEEFSSLSYDEIIQMAATANTETEDDESEATVDDSFLESAEFIIKPGDVENEILTLHPDMKYLGVAAGFIRIDDSNWRHTYLRQRQSGIIGGNNYLYLKVNALDVEQISREEMAEELETYRQNHPEDTDINEYGRFATEQEKIDLSKGIFRDVTSD